MKHFVTITKEFIWGI